MCANIDYLTIPLAVYRSSALIATVQNSEYEHVPPSEMNLLYAFFCAFLDNSLNKYVFMFLLSFVLSYDLFYHAAAALSTVFFMFFAFIFTTVLAIIAALFNISTSNTQKRPPRFTTRPQNRAGAIRAYLVA